MITPSETQLLNESLSGSYWMSGFLTGCNYHQYLVLSHALIGVSQTSSYYRGSIFDITTSSYSSFFIPELIDAAVPASNPFKIATDNYTLGALSADNVSKLYTTAEYGSNGFNLTFAAEHPILYNIGSGTFTFGNGISNEWGMPSGRTKGTLTTNGELIDLIPEESFTWYDRQWGTGAPVTGNWTWYELHLPCGVKASIWAWDNATPKQHVRAATLLYPNGETKVVPFEWTPNSAKTWLSPKSGILYPQQWTLEFPDGGIIQVTSVFGGQEIYGGAALSASSYEGFINVTGIFEGKPVAGTAFGLVEMERFVS
jgi:predicted secreted hydrolase